MCLMRFSMYVEMLLVYISTRAGQRSLSTLRNSSCVKRKILMDLEKNGSNAQIPAGKNLKQFIVLEILSSDL